MMPSKKTTPLTTVFTLVSYRPEIVGVYLTGDEAQEAGLASGLPERHREDGGHWRIIETQVMAP